MHARPFPYQESSKFPFSETSMFYVSDTLSFPYDFLADAHVYTTNKEQYEITRILKKGHDLTLWIGNYIDQDQIIGSYCFEDAESNVIELFDRYGRRAGMLVIKSAPAMQFFPDGDYTLISGTAIFEISCHVPIPMASVTGFVVNNRLMSGDVKMIGTHGVILTRQDNTVTVHFVGEPYYNKWRAVENNDHFFDRYVSRVTVSVDDTINQGKTGSLMLQPDKNGNIPIFANYNGNALRIKGAQSRLSFSLAGK